MQRLWQVSWQKFEKTREKRENFDAFWTNVTLLLNNLQFSYFSYVQIELRHRADEISKSFENSMKSGQNGILNNLLPWFLIFCVGTVGQEIFIENQ